MAVTTRLRLFYLLHLSKPARDRRIHQCIWDNQVRKILEFGVRDGERALRMIEVAAQTVPSTQVCYTGVDLFETRPTAQGDPLPLKAAYKILRATGAKIRLWPGDPASVLARMAIDRPQRLDLVVVSADQGDAAMAQTWFHLPRLLHKESQVLVEEGKGAAVEVRILAAREVLGRAERARRLRREA